MIKRIIIPFLVCFGNFWIWFIFTRNLWLGLILILETVLFNLVINKFNIKFLALFIFIYFFLAAYLLSTAFDKDIYKENPTEALMKRQRYEYLATDLGKIYKNRFSIFYHDNVNPILYKIQNNIFSAMDINVYFFAGHPREREKVFEYEKYPFIFWPFFLFGIYLSIKKARNLLLLYFIISLLISSLIKQDLIFGPILFFPLINFILIDSFNYLINFISNKKHRND